MKDTREENAITPELKNIHQRVDRIRHSEEVSKAYMKYYEELWDAKKEGIEEGIEQGTRKDHEASIRKLAQHLMSKDASQSEEDAMREAELILR